MWTNSIFSGQRVVVSWILVLKSTKKRGLRSSNISVCIFFLGLQNTLTPSLQRSKAPAPTSVLFMTLNNPVMPELWGLQCTPWLLSLPGPLWSVMVAPDWVLSMGPLEQNCVLMQNWIVWNWTVFWHWNCVPVLNWIVSKRNILTFNSLKTKQKTELFEIELFLYKNGFDVNNL